MAAFPESGRSDEAKFTNMDGSFRPRADYRGRAISLRRVGKKRKNSCSVVESSAEPVHYVQNKLGVFGS